MTRRDLFGRIVKGFALAGLGLAAWPFVKSWLPDFGRPSGLEVSLADLGTGGIKRVRWSGRNVLIMRRGRDMLQSLEREGDLKDPGSSASKQPLFAMNRWRSRRPEYFVAFSACTHLGCEVTAREDGFVCPCDHAAYDYAGRVRKDAIAPLNLAVPNYRFVSGNLIRLEEEDV